MSLFKKKKKSSVSANASVATSASPKSKNQRSSVSDSRRGSIAESVVSIASTVSSGGSMVRAHWRAALSAQGSTWHSRATLLLGRDLIVLGAQEATLENTEPSTQLYICDTNTMGWSTAGLKGKGPGLAGFYAAITNPYNTDRLFVLWPCPQKGRIARVIHPFVAKKTGELTVEKGKLFVVLDETDSVWYGGATTEGGMGVVPRSCLSFENVPVQQTTRLELNVLNFMADMQWNTMICDGELPKCRKYFTYNSVGQNKIFLFGGLTDFNEPINSAYVLDTDKYHWKRCTSKVAIPPKARYAHSSTLISDDTILIYGGTDGTQYFDDMFLFKTETYTWQVVKTKGRNPEARAFHTMTRIDNTPWVVLFGGRNGAISFSDVYLFNTVSSTWHKALMLGDMPSARYNHFGACNENTAFYFGGRDERTNFFDIYTLEFEGLPQERPPDLPIEDSSNLAVESSSSVSPRVRRSSTEKPVVRDLALVNAVRANETIGIVSNAVEKQSHIMASHTNQYDHYRRQQQSPQHLQNLQQQQQYQNGASENDVQRLSPLMKHQEEDDVEEELATLIRGGSPISGRSVTPEWPQLKVGNASHSSSFRDLIRSASPTPSNGRPSSPRSVRSPSRLSPRPGTPLRQRAKSPGSSSLASNTLEEKYAIDKTFGDVSSAMERRINQEHLLKSMGSDQKLGKSEQDEKAMELSVSFGDFVFGNEARPGTPVSESATAEAVAMPTLDFATFASEEEQFFNGLFDSIKTVNLNAMLRLLRFAKIFDNRVTWLDAFTILARCLSVEESSLDGSEVLKKPQFRKFLAEIAKLKYPKFAKESTVLALQHMIEADIKPNVSVWKTVDNDLDAILQANIIKVFSARKKQIQDLFIMYSALGILSSLVPTWQEVVNKGSTISVAEFMTFTDTFDVTPHLVPRHVMSRRILSQASTTNSACDLNFNEFNEALGRIALHVYRKYPYSELMATDSERIEALFDSIGLNDRRKFVMYVKKGGIGAQNKVNAGRYFLSNRQTSPEAQDAREQISDDAKKKYEMLLKDKDQLKDELQRIFMCYCSFGDHLNLDAMSSSKFLKFVRDLRIKPPLKPEEADLIFLSLMKNKGQRDGLEDVKLLKMTFPYFIESIKTVASKVHPDIAPTKALVRFLVSNVLPNARKMPEKFTNVDLKNEKVHELMKQHHKLIRALFFVYSASDSPDRPAHDYMRVEDFVKMMSEFDIIPGIISKKDVYIIFRSALVDSAYVDITFDQFEECLVKCGAIAYDRHPYNIKYYGLDQKVEALLENLGIPDWIKIRKKLVKLGHSVPATPAILMQRNGAESARDYNFYGRDYLPPERELDQALRDIFSFYNEYGDKSGRKNLTRQQYIKMVRDANLVDNQFKEIDADLVYMEATKNNQLTMVHEIFCDSLALLAQRKFHQMSITNALHDLLLHHVLPYAQRKDSGNRGFGTIVEPEMVQEVLKWEQPLRKIFSSYSKLEALRTTVGQYREGGNQNLTISNLLKMCQDFDICPALLSVSDINDIFAISNQGDLSDEDDTQLTFEEFTEVVVRMAEKAFSSNHMATVYKTSKERINALLERMDLGSAVRLAERLRRIRNFERK